MMEELKINTSNKHKYGEFKDIFAHYGKTLDRTSIDIDEILAEPEKVINHKCTCMGQNIIAEDTSLFVEGAPDVGVEIRWVLDNLKDLVGRKANWVVFIGVLRGEEVFLYKGEVEGIIVKKRGDSDFGFDPVFEAKETGKTLAEYKPYEVNARALAIKNLVEGNVYSVEKPIKEWDGPWQSH